MQSPAGGGEGPAGGVEGPAGGEGPVGADSEECDQCSSYVDVKWKCEDCEEYLCTSCKNIHQTTEQFNGHKVLPVEEEEVAIVEEVEKSTSHGYCSTHQNEPYYLYCKNCDCLVCEDCIISEHKKHSFDKMTNVPVQEKREELINCLDKVKDKPVADLTEAVETLQENIKDYTKQLDEIIDDIEDSSDRLKKEIDKVRNNVLKQVRNHGDNDKDKLRDAKKDMEKELRELKRAIQDCEKKFKNLQTGSNSDDLTFIMETKRKLAKYETNPIQIPKIRPPSFSTSKFNKILSKSLQAHLQGAMKVDKVFEKHNGKYEEIS